MKKKIIISSFLMGTAISILPLNFVFNNKNYEEKGIENEILNQEEEISNSANLNTRGGYLDAVRGKKHSAFFYNNFTNPVVSPNADIPGFLGAWDNYTIGSFPTAIAWSTPDIFVSWSANLMDHPSLKNDKNLPAGFSPGLVTALHSDNKFSTIKRNQVFAIVANSSNLSEKRYWILRYNALDGSPIFDSNSEMPKMTNAPLPKTNSTDFNFSSFALANDTINNRYIAFYPGRIGDLKNDIFGFELTNDNKIVWLENKTNFDGHKNWGSLPENPRNDLDDENIVIGLAPYNVKGNASDPGGFVLMVATRTRDSSNNLGYNFKAINFRPNFSLINGFTTNTIIGRNESDFNSQQGTIFIRQEFFNLEKVQRNINPNLQLFSSTDEQGQISYKVQMVVPILKNNNWLYMYLGSIFNNRDNTYHVSIGNSGGLSQGTFFNSPSPSADSVAPYITYNENLPQEFLLVSQESLASTNRFIASQFIFVNRPPDGPWSPTRKTLHTFVHTPPNINLSHKQILIRVPHLEDNYMWSVPNGFTQYHHILDNDPNVITWNQFSGGGVFREDFQKTASDLKWLRNQENSKFPSEITAGELQTIGTTNTNFFQYPRIEFPSSITVLTPTLTLFGQPTRDDIKGTIEGIFTLNRSFIIKRKTYRFISKIPFKVSGLNQRSDVPTSISPNNSILNFLPSDLTPDNVIGLIDVVAAPENATIDNWTISNQNNAAGTATISVRVNPHFDQNGNIQNSPKIFTTNATGLRKLNGTTANLIPNINKDLNVWDISSNPSGFVEINDLIPNSPSDAVTYSVKDILPLIGEITISVSIKSGWYYDPRNNGLPSIIGGSPLDFELKVTGLETVSETIVSPKTGPFFGIFPAFIDENNITEFFTIENEVPGSKFTITDIKRSDSTATKGSVTFTINFDKSYDKSGFIITNHKETHTIEGFEGGIAPTETKALPIANSSLFSNTLALEINESNINQFIVLVNLPQDTTPRYEFKNQKNTGQPNTGFLDVAIILPRYINSSGTIVNTENTYNVKLENLKTIPAATSVIALSGESDILPEFVNEFTLDKYLSITNPSTIPNKESLIRVEPNSLVKNNINGSISFEYKLINAISEFGFVEESRSITAIINGFQRGGITNFEQIKDLKNEKASEFNLNKDNFFTYFEFIGYSIPQETDENGNTTGTVVTKVEKISFDDSIGSATFKVSIEGGAINQQGNFTFGSLDINLNFDGFEIVKPADNTIPIIAGSVAGGILLIILIIVAIILINNNKNKKILNEKRKPSAPSAPPVNPGVAKSVPPSQGTPSPMSTAGPSVKPPTPGSVSPTPPRPGVPPIPPKK
ncbi:MAG: hypothetical protein ACRDCD_00330 [Mycoplasmoidaceae bacterium]